MYPHGLTNKMQRPDLIINPKHANQRIPELFQKLFPPHIHHTIIFTFLLIDQLYVVLNLLSLQAGGTLFQHYDLVGWVAFVIRHLFASDNLVQFIFYERECEALDVLVFVQIFQFVERCWLDVEQRWACDHLQQFFHHVVLAECEMLDDLVHSHVYAPANFFTPQLWELLVPWFDLDRLETRRRLKRKLVGEQPQLESVGVDLHDSVDELVLRINEVEQFDCQFELLVKGQL